MIPEALGMTMAAIGGGVVGYMARGPGQTPAPIDYARLVEEMIAQKPVNYEVVDLDASEARSEKEIPVVASFMEVGNYPSSVHFYVRFNEPNNPQMDLSQLKYVSGPVYRIFVTNIAGKGAIQLRAGRGMTFQSQIETLAELAVRINFGVPNTYDRRGEVIFADSFDNSALPEWTQTSMNGGTVAQDLTISKNGKASLKYTNGLNPGSGAGIDIYRALMEIGRIGYELSFTAPPAAGVALHCFLLHRNGVERISALATITGSGSDCLTIGNPPHAIALPFGLYKQAVMDKCFHTMKFVADLAARKWVRISLDAESFDLSSYDLDVSADADLPNLWLNHNVTGPGAWGTMNTDEFLLTREP